MDDKQLEELKKHLEGVVRETVNGEIADLSEMIGKHQEEVKPMLEWFVGMKFTRKIGLGILYVAGALVGILLGIKKLL